MQVKVKQSCQDVLREQNVKFTHTKESAQSPHNFKKTSCYTFVPDYPSFTNGFDKTSPFYTNTVTIQAFWNVLLNLFAKSVQLSLLSVLYCYLTPRNGEDSSGRQCNCWSPCTSPALFDFLGRRCGKLSFEHLSGNPPASGFELLHVTSRSLRKKHCNGAEAESSTETNSNHSKQGQADSYILLHSSVM